MSKNKYQHLPGNHPSLDNARHRMRLMARRVHAIVAMEQPTPVMRLPIDVYRIVDEITVSDNGHSYKVICDNLSNPELKGLYRFDAKLQCYVIGINLDKLNEAERRFYVALGLGVVVSGGLQLDGQHAVSVKDFSTLLDMLTPENPGSYWSYLLMDFACELIAPEMDFLILQSFGHPDPTIGKIMDVPIEVIQYTRDQQAQ